MQRGAAGPSLAGLLAGTRVETSLGLLPVEEIVAGMQLRAKAAGFVPVFSTGMTLARGRVVRLCAHPMLSGRLSRPLALPGAQQVLLTGADLMAATGHEAALAPARAIGVPVQDCRPQQVIVLRLQTADCLRANGAWVAVADPEGATPALPVLDPTTALALCGTGRQAA